MPPQEMQYWLLRDCAILEDAVKPVPDHGSPCRPDGSSDDVEIFPNA